MTRLVAGASLIAIAVCLGLPNAGSARADSFSIDSGTETEAQTVTGTDTGSVAAGAALTTKKDPAITWTGVSDDQGVVITNAGTISSTKDRGIDTDDASGSFTLDNLEGATLSADDDAFRIKDDADVTVVINNDGTITSDTGQAIDFGKLESADASVTINNGATGVIEALDNDAIRPGSGTIVIDNAGLIDATAGTDRGINVENYTSIVSLIITNEEGGTIKATGDAIRVTEDDDDADLDAATGTFVIDNAGTIASTGTGDDSGQAIDLNNLESPSIGATIINRETGVITAADADAIRPGTNGTVYNSGTIYGGTASDEGNDGIDFQDDTGGVVTNTSTGTITGTRHGITGDEAVTVYNDGTITGLAGSGINIDNGIYDPDNDEAVIASNGTVVVYNSGTITGTANGGDGDGIDVDGLLYLENSGTIQAVGTSEDQINEGLAIGGGTIINTETGVITGTGRAITVNDSDLGDAVGATTITNAGSIVGGTDGAIKITGPYADTLTNSGTISGDVWLGAGDDTLNAYTGSSIDGTVDGEDGEDTVNLEGTGTGTLFDTVDFEVLNVNGGSWTVDTDQSFSSGTTIADAASLYADANLDSVVTVNSGGTLGGTGTVSGLDVSGTVTPGDTDGDVASLTVAGDAAFQSGSTYAVDISGTTADSIAVSGIATLSGGTVVAGALTNPDATYVILTADGGVTGTFDAVTADEDFLFLDPALTYAATSVSLGLDRNAVAFADLAVSDNGRSVAAALDTAASGDLYDALLAQTTAAGASQAFQLASGEVYAGIGSALIGADQASGDLILSHLRSIKPGQASGPAAAPLAYDEASDVDRRFSRFGYPSRPSLGGVEIWGTGYGDWTDYSGDDVADLDTKTGGFLVGVDGAIGDWTVGLAGGYAHTDIDADSLASSADADSYQIAVYGGRSFGAVNLAFGGSYAYHDIDVSRRVVFPGFSNDLSASVDGDSARLFGEVSYDLALGGIAVQPFAGLSYTHFSLDDFTETGGSAALESDGYDQNVGASTLGLRLATSFSAGEMTLKPRAMIGWRHGFGDVDPDVTLSFADTGADFSVSGSPIARNAALVEAGLDVEIAPNATLGLSYRGSFASDATSNGVTGRFAVKF
ncbi:autotransporter outer membrane beta-barrel domain-containing protein [Jiella mangrovi]|uniref:Autotransporter domain-containing protein n=1 Tax=Jiella mangrovi TaxID=2821407 RepID=A0ABS4BL21_9HYPH|nr:autotransporter domain-containing protein [Jiella mangrovi]MBP0617432.1 autotransporter domain-containing protein [Jiella mangrovi]